MRPTTNQLASLMMGLALVAITAAAAGPTRVMAEPGGPLPVAVAIADADGTARYVVQLADAPIIAYDGSLPGLAATAPAGATDGVDLARPPAWAYDRYLAGRQLAVEAAVGRLAPGARALYYYRVAFNGLAFRLTPDQARAVASLPGVVAVTREERVVPLLDTSLDQIAAPAAWADPLVGGRALAGRGVRIAVIDSGITAAHPFFADTGFQAPAGFPKATLTIGTDTCAYGAEDRARFTNHKVIVARAYVNPEVAGAAPCADQLASRTPLADGAAGFHGAHVAGIAGGVVVQGGPGAGGNGNLTLSGVAPGAYLMAYKFTDAYTPEILAMIDDAVADGAQVINNSWGLAAMNVLDPAAHPVAQAFAAATRAGVVVVAAAGNSGSNGEATLGGPFQMIRDVITVANVQGGRTFRYVVIANDPELPAELHEHPAVYVDVGKPFDVIEAQNYSGDLCNPLAALRARGKVALASTTTQCDTSSLPIQLPIPIPPQLSFIVQLIVAQQVQARAVVLWAPDAQQAQVVVAALPLVQQLLGLELPITAVIGGPPAESLDTFADTHPAMTLRLESTPARVVDPALVDRANDTSSQGPAPDFGGATLKPDLAAPGTDILSTNTDQAGEPNGYTTASGTSMASPHVAGAAAVLRQAWPAWTPAQIKAALMTTADPVVKVGTDLAPATVQGSGRLNLGRAVDPGVLVTPPSLYLGRRTAGEVKFTLNAQDVRRDGRGPATWQVRHEPGPGNSAVAPALPAEVVVPAGGSARFDITFTLPPGLAPGDYDGRIALQAGDRVVRVVYFLRVPGDRRDVLLINVRRSAQAGALPIPGLGGFEDTTDYSRYWTEALDTAGLSYDVWTVAAGQETGTPPLHVLQHYDLVIVAAGDGNAPLDRLPGGMTALQMYLLGGGHMLASGGQWAHALTALQSLNIQGSGAMYYLSRYFGGFELTGDDRPLAGDLTPVRLFDRPVALSATAGPEAAGNGGAVDVGRPLAELVTSAPPGQLAPDLGLAAPDVVTRLQPYMRSYLEVTGGGSVMTGVTPDATLEQPVRSTGIPWAALFAGFGLEAVTPLPGHHARDDMLRVIFRWATEPPDMDLTLNGPAACPFGHEARLSATARSPAGVTVQSWRWDPGNGRPYVATDSPGLTVICDRAGSLTVRVEATTVNGRTWVAERRVPVTGGALYLPWAAKSQR